MSLWKKRFLCITLMATMIANIFAVPVTAAENLTPEEKRINAQVKMNQVLVLGDCRVEGFRKKKIIRSNRIISVVGVSTETMWRKKSSEIKRKGKHTKKVYIALGINSAGSVSITTKSMKKFIKRMKKACPKAEIIIQNVIPENLKNGQSDHGVTNKKVRQINKNFKKIAEKDNRVAFYTIQTKIHYSPDRVHFYDKTYKAIGKEVYKYLKIKKK